MGPFSILVVDDEEFIRKLCGRILGAGGHTPLFAETLALAEERIASLERLDLLVSDLRLPDGCGLEVIRAARARFPRAAVLVITACPDLEALREEYRGLGIPETDILTKPFSIARFEDAVREKLAAGGNTAEGS
jgi:DNA-binding NtrC family response regulator